MAAGERVTDQGATVTDPLAPPTPQEAMDALHRLFGMPSTIGRDGRLLEDFIHHYEALLETNAHLVQQLIEMEREASE